MMAIDIWRGQRLNYGDTLVYRAAYPGAANQNAPVQTASKGPYRGKIADFTDTAIGVRLDGFMGSAALYYVYPMDIISVQAS